MRGINTEAQSKREGKGYPQIAQMTQMKKA